MPSTLPADDAGIGQTEAHAAARGRAPAVATTDDRHRRRLVRGGVSTSGIVAVSVGILVLLVVIVLYVVSQRRIPSGARIGSPQ